MTLTIMVALRVILHRLEALLPLPSPWIKSGLANLMTLVALVLLVFKEAVIVTFLRVVIGSILGDFFRSDFFSKLGRRYCSNTYNGCALSSNKKSHEFDRHQHIRSLYAYSCNIYMCLLFSYS